MGGSKVEDRQPDTPLEGEMGWGGGLGGGCGSDIGEGFRQIIDACKHDPTLFIDILSLGTIVQHAKTQFDIKADTDLVQAVGRDYLINVVRDYVLTVQDGLQVDGKDRLKLVSDRNIFIDAPNVYLRNAVIVPDSWYLRREVPKALDTDEQPYTHQHDLAMSEGDWIADLESDRSVHDSDTRPVTLGEMATTVSDNGGRLTVVEAELSEHSDRLTVVEAELVTVNSTIAALSASLTALTGTVSGLQSSLSSLQSTVSSLSAQVADMANSGGSGGDTGGDTGGGTDPTPTNVVATPSVITPTNGARNVAMPVFVAGSPYTITTGEHIAIAKTVWMLSPDPSFTGTVKTYTTHLSNPGHYTEYEQGTQVAVIYGLEPNTKYYVKLQYHAFSGDVSDWSSVSTFTTAA